MRVLVTGGFGGLGTEVVRRLRQRYAEVTPVSRRTGFDLVTGAGVADAVARADVIVHAASHPLRYRAVDLDGTRRIIASALRRDVPPHLVYVSIVGCDRNPYPYYRAKYACELALTRSGLGVTVVRATQFHPLVEALAGAVTLGPVALVPRMSFQSCDRGWVAEHLVDVAMGAPPVGYRRAVDLAGPEVVSLEDAVRRLRHRDARPVPRMLRLPVVGGALKAFAAGTNLPGPGSRTGGSSFGEWLEAGR